VTDSPADHAFTAAEVKETAELAAISCDEESLGVLSRAFVTLLAHFEIISRVEILEAVHGTPVERSVALGDLRTDETDQGVVTGLHQAASDFEDGFFFVPRVML
jgi:aspartyl/glutamyl-tRNA(Asn/Gln) amidotransferase C subunit